MRLYDTHCHFERADPVEIAAILARAKAAGVEKLMAVGGSSALNESAALAVQVAADSLIAPKVVCAVGYDREQIGKKCGVRSAVVPSAAKEDSSLFALSTKHQALSTIIWATGDQLEKARQVASRVPGTEVVFARYLKPFDAELLKRQRAEGKRIVSIENGAIAGGFGEAIGADLKFGWPDEFIPHGSVAELEKRYGFDVESIVRRLNG